MPGAFFINNAKRPKARKALQRKKDCIGGDSKKHTLAHVGLHPLQRLLAGLHDRLATDPVRIGGELGGDLKVLSDSFASGVLSHKLCPIRRRHPDGRKVTGK